MHSKPAFNAVRFAEARVEVETRPDGITVLRSPQPLGDYPAHMGFHLRHWAKTAPDRIFLAERDVQGEWRRLGYLDALSRVESLGQFLLDQNLSIDRPLMVLSENSIDLAMLTLAGLYVGVPVVPVSPAYALMSQGFAKLRAIHDLVVPGMIYAREGGRYAKAIDAIRRPDAVVVVNDGDVPSSLRFDDVLRTQATRAVTQAFDRVDPDDVAKILFTSGSTGEPKGVLTTHRMLCANQQSIAQCWPFLEDSPPIVLDWLPWSHAFGANHNFNLILRNGGSFYIDDGRPVPGLIERTVRNLRDVSPTLYFNAPRGFDMLIPFLETDESLRDDFFRKLDLIFYAGAALPQHLWDRLEKISIAARGNRVRMVSSWGATETTCTAASVHFDIERAGVIGLPPPGVELMLAPSSSRTELRVRGPIVTPGYWKRPDLTAAAFDDEGFYRMGDAGRLDDANDPSKGIVFDGRVAEDFKLLSGTWVRSGLVRLETIAACTPVVQDVVVTGLNRECIGLLVFLNQSAARNLADDPTLSAEQLAADASVRLHVARGLATYNQGLGSSMRIERFALMTEQPSIDKGEITDKGYINQRAVIELRAEWIERLYDESPSVDVVKVDAAQ